jgi:hypothetical protein
LVSIVHLRRILRVVLWQPMTDIITRNVAAFVMLPAILVRESLSASGSAPRQLS